MAAPVFKDQVAIITGASSGIGWELALQLADQGARVVLAARHADKLAAWQRNAGRAVGRPWLCPLM